MKGKIRPVVFINVTIFSAFVASNLRMQTPASSGKNLHFYKATIHFQHLPALPGLQKTLSVIIHVIITLILFKPKKREATHFQKPDADGRGALGREMRRIRAKRRGRRDFLSAVR